MTTVQDHLTALDARRRSRGPECASALALDQLELGELAGESRTRVMAHLAACADCARAREAVAADRARFEAEVAVPTLAADALMRAQRAPSPASMWSRVRRFLIPMTVTAAGAFTVAMFLGTRDELRSKGDFSLSAYVLHPEEGGAAGNLHAGEPLHPGDKLQFRYNGSRAGYLAIVAVDQAGEVSVYYPPGATAAPVTAGRDVPLSSAVELDSTLGAEEIVGVRCDAALPVADVVAATRKAARARGEVSTLGLPCVETRLRIEKRARR